jgi:hypothetical protein
VTPKITSASERGSIVSVPRARATSHLAASSPLHGNRLQVIMGAVPDAPEAP